MNPSAEPESNPNSPDARKSLFGALARSIKINVEHLGDWNAAKEAVDWDAVGTDDTNQEPSSVERYNRAYQQVRETEGELSWIGGSSIEALADLPWDGEAPSPEQ